MQKQTNPGNDLLRYAGLGGQILVALGIAVFAGYKADKWLKISFPLLVWALPLIVVSLMIYKLIKDTSKKKE
ncbi:AtpZ/AtpI family protein [Flavisolibacter ginsenosidimutans]|uniref:AtpZ/AtpI family protein n=1 Tax=Flavisolibacter ginsenosidimutans TaxID=661481 RepID=A0A5B8UQZ1_9BACT|nr:AtpZ/AtpI family protein [Flavisolibacter ginsenosidimutans]QEC58345.1 AtpZ/AtpI family protein [Flavisolibacter ginsenosidimutans]